jgi:anaerobic ribonucleoside-triphosphate reductase activating protein
MTDFLQVHHVESSSAANGPGRRFVIWLQGCTLNCPGCFNPETHLRSGGEKTTVADLISNIIALTGLEGVTISGGEPFQQPIPLAALLTEIRAKTRLSVVLFTGFTWAECARIVESQSILSSIDVLIAGRYQANQRVAHSLTGSANKKFYFITNRYSQKDFAQIPEAEAIIDTDGTISFSGINPLLWL